MTNTLLRNYLDPRFMAPTMLAICILLSGCGALHEKSMIRGQFRSTFSCNDDKVTNYNGLFVVQGCGVTAHYKCYSTGSNDGVMDDVLYGGNSCVQIHHHIVGKEPRRPVEQLTVMTTPEGHRHIRALVFSDAGRLLFVGSPEQFPDRVAVYLDFSSPLNAQESCNIRLVADGERIEEVKSGLVDDNRTGAQFTIPIAGLKQVGNASRLVGDVCGRSLKIDQVDLEILQQFHIRFREMLNLR